MHPTILEMDALAPLLNRTLLLVAHPDDESISCGALLQRIREAIVVYGTDGGPEDPYFWGKYGSVENYVALRRQEATNALGAVGVHNIHWLADDEGHLFRDQHLFRNLPAAAQALRKLIAEWRPDVLLTLAYEGLEMAAEPGLTLTIYTAEPGSPAEEGLRLLSSWAATQEASSPAPLSS